MGLETGVKHCTPARLHLLSQPRSLDKPGEEPHNPKMLDRPNMDGSCESPQDRGLRWIKNGLRG